ncbi:MAG: DUF134 domain-containing protein [Desulfobaccales bacterium]
MSRPRKCRWVEREPGVTYFKPQGVPLKNLEQVIITVDELEALRLSDLLNHSHEATAQQMKVSRPTVTRMLARAHRAIADALVNGKAIRIEGGDYILETCHTCCPTCGKPLHRLTPLPDNTVCHACERGEEGEATPAPEGGSQEGEG